MVNFRVQLFICHRVYNNDVFPYGGFRRHRGTPNSHPFLDRIFPLKPSIVGVLPWRAGTPHPDWLNNHPQSIPLPGKPINLPGGYVIMIYFLCISHKISHPISSAGFSVRSVSWSLKRSCPWSTPTSRWRQLPTYRRYRGGQQWGWLNGGYPQISHFW